ncbi:MAG: hypothetical protein GVY13_00405 [Alphaproteobacteria bacterium]|jgi:putative glutamine amidotransferase|nr:hypothetical protein [Alphaproteobacteria bacterium]
MVTAPGRADHRSDKDKSVGEQYGSAHPVRLIEGGRLARLFGMTEIIVNSLHGQGIDRPASRLAVEAVHVIDAVALALGVAPSATRPAPTPPGQDPCPDRGRSPSPLRAAGTSAMPMGL